MRYAIFALLVAPLWAQETGGGPGADPARLFPSDTFVYAEVDASAIETCLPEGQISKILTDLALKPFFKPALEKLGLDPEKPVEALLKKFPVKEVLDGRAAVGVRGMSLVMRDAAGKEWSFRVSPQAPLDGRTMYRYLGMMAALFDSPFGGGKVTIVMDVDFLAVGRPGPLGKQLIEQALAEMGGEVTRETVKIAGLDATHVHLDQPIFGGLSYAFNFYAAERDGTWFLASQTDVLEQALSGGPRTSLAGSASLAQARQRLTSGRPLLFAHVDLALLLGIYKGFVFPIAQEMGDIAGINSLRGIGFGISLVDGGVRESLGILLDGNPRGFWKILDAMPGGLRSLEVAPPGALAAFGVKLDLTVLRERLRAFCADVVPGNEDAMETEFTRDLQPFDLQKDLLPALGDEAAVLVYPAGPNEILPRFVVGFDGRDEAALARLVAKVQAEIPADVAQFTPVDLPEGTKAVCVSSRSGYNIHYAVSKRHLFIGSDAKVLVEVLTKWGAEGSPSLVRDDPVLPLVLKATNGGDTRNLAALGYLNLRGCGTEALKSLNWWKGGIPAEWFDVNGVGELRRIPNHLTGAAIAFRHDKDGLVLDCYSPVGLLVPATVSAVLFASGPRMQVAQGMPPPPRAGSGKASLGINQWSRDGAAVKVLGLVPEGPAAVAGLLQGDRIVGLGGVAVASIEDLARELAKRKPGDSVEVKVRRGDEEISVTVELGEEEGW